MKLKNLTQNLILLLKCHIAALYAQVDPVTSDSSPNHEWSRVHFVIPILLYIYVNLYGMIYMPYELEGSDKFRFPHSPLTSPYIYVRLCSLSEIRAQYDLAALVAISSAFCLFWNFLLNPRQPTSRY